MTELSGGWFLVAGVRHRLAGGGPMLVVLGCLVTWVAVCWPAPVLGLARSRFCPNSLHLSVGAGEGGVPWLSSGFCPWSVRAGPARWSSRWHQAAVAVTPWGGWCRWR